MCEDWCKRKRYTCLWCVNMTDTGVNYFIFIIGKYFYNNGIRYLMIVCNFNEALLSVY